MNNIQRIILLACDPRRASEGISENFLLADGSWDYRMISRTTTVPEWKANAEFLRGLFLHFVPMALNVDTSALSASCDAHEQGASFSDTDKSAVRPAKQSAIHGAVSQFDQEQQGSGPTESGGLSPSMHKALYKGHKSKRTKPIIYNY